MAYKLANEKNPTGYKGKRLSNDNLSSYPERLLKIWEKAGIIVHLKDKSKSKKKDE